MVCLDLRDLVVGESKGRERTPGECPVCATVFELPFLSEKRLIYRGWNGLSNIRS